MLLFKIDKFNVEKSYYAFLNFFCENSKRCVLFASYAKMKQAHYEENLAQGEALVEPNHIFGERLIDYFK